MEQITKDQLEHAKRLLEYFCANIDQLYGSRYELANCHLLLHLIDCVKQLGPLWTHSCSHFEDCNGFLVKLIHGTQYIQFQILCAVSMLQGISLLAQKYLASANERSKELYRKWPISAICDLQKLCRFS